MLPPLRASPSRRRARSAGPRSTQSSAVDDSIRKIIGMQAAKPASSSLLIITGSMGSGKTAVMAEASDILALRGIPHAAIDLDLLGMAHLPGSAPSDDVMCRNLRAVAQNYAALGIDRFMVARAVENQAELERCVDAVAAQEVA